MTLANPSFLGGFAAGPLAAVMLCFRRTKPAAAFVAVVGLWLAVALWGWYLPFPGTVLTQDRVVFWSVGSTAYPIVIVLFIYLVFYGGARNAPELIAVVNALRKAMDYLMDQNGWWGFLPVGILAVIIWISVAEPFPEGFAIALVLLYILTRSLLALTSLPARLSLIYPSLVLCSCILVPIDGAGHLSMPFLGLALLAKMALGNPSSLVILAVAVAAVGLLLVMGRLVEARHFLLLALLGSAIFGVLDVAGQQPAGWRLAQELGTSEAWPWLDQTVRDMNHYTSVWGADFSRAQECRVDSVETAKTCEITRETVGRIAPVFSWRWAQNWWLSVLLGLIFPYSLHAAVRASTKGRRLQRANQT